ncbi:OPT superfamily oligopeptide transporter [Rhizoclosmatium globosum]|uniref:OPT superfamily oligopeptide transporter n=1 Tax=Rhizoclosmatium globosum TaxID=329046 RepID=A0A1Y2CUK2_9FUNG|nr:OPT superfamily oligopeptide transporter [Rhizoclosmatium globosum]|eukprot:ORY50514.1 OPT superfamily oligopeptide transporter [Rhizoclosmatium globosum]
MKVEAPPNAEVLDQEKKLDEFIQENHLEEDVEVSDIADILERIEFIVPQTDDPSPPPLLGELLSWESSGGASLDRKHSPLIPNQRHFHSNFLRSHFDIPNGCILCQSPSFRWLDQPRPFSMKEHVLSYVISSSGGGYPYGIDNYYHLARLVLHCRHPIIGFGFSGVTRRFLVKPTAMWWPQNLSTIAFFIFHDFTGLESEAASKFKMSRFSFFWIVWRLSSCRGNGATGVMTTTNAIASSAYNGAGVFALTFDWQYIMSSYMTSPFWASAIRLVGSITFGWIITPIMWSKDVFGLNALIGAGTNGAPSNPLLNSPGLFNGNISSPTVGQRVSSTYFYNKSAGYNLDVDKYNNVAPVHLTLYYALAYACTFMTLPAAIVHVALWYGQDIYRQAKNAFKQVKDEIDALDKHAKMNEAYAEVQIAIGLNVLSQLIISLMIPGETVAVMIFKSWGTNNINQSLLLSSDLKLGHYLHIPPVSWLPLNALELWSTRLFLLFRWFMMFNTGDLLGHGDWMYTGHKVFYNAGGIWGAIGAKRFFGVVLPWLANRYVYKSKYWHYISFPLFFQMGGPSMGVQNYVVVPFIVAFISQVLVFHRYRGFYEKYSYVLGSALDTGTGFVVFLTSIFGVFNIAFTSWNPLNPSPNVPSDYYCYPGTTYVDYACDFYTAQEIDVSPTCGQ